MQNIKKILGNHQDFFFIFLGCFRLKVAYANGKKIVVPLNFFYTKIINFIYKLTQDSNTGPLNIEVTMLPQYQQESFLNEILTFVSV